MVQSLEERAQAGAVIEPVRTHSAPVTGHGRQIRYVRGTYGRAFGTDKRVLDTF